MTIRAKVRILLLVSVSLTVFYIISHVYRLNSWFLEKSIRLTQQQDIPGQSLPGESLRGTPTTGQPPPGSGNYLANDEAVVDPPGVILHNNATTDATESLPNDATKIQTLFPNDDDLLAQYQPHNRSTPFQQQEQQQRSPSPQQPKTWSSDTKHLQDPANILPNADVGGGKAENGPANSQLDVLPVLKTSIVPTERVSGSGGDTAVEVSGMGNGNISEEELEDEFQAKEADSDGDDVPNNATEALAVDISLPGAIPYHSDPLAAVPHTTNLSETEATVVSPDISVIPSQIPVMASDLPTISPEVPLMVPESSLISFQFPKEAPKLPSASHPESSAPSSAGLHVISPDLPVGSPSVAYELPATSSPEPPLKPPSELPVISPKEKEIGDCRAHEHINEEQPTIKPKCDFYSNHLRTCTESARYFNPSKLSAPGNCSDLSSSPICRFAKMGENVKMSLQCEYDICYKNQARVGVVNYTTGYVEYAVATSLKSVARTLQREAAENTGKENRIDFVLLTCKSKSKKNQFLHQVLTLPPLVLTDIPPQTHLPVEEQRVTKKINVNIIVIDSLSRKHFYRTLPKTVGAMRAINADVDGATQILDFKGFQSLAPFTYVNLQALLTGSVDYESKANINNRTYNFEELFGLFQKTGYQVLAQEDTCWYDEWGSIFTGNRRLDNHGPAKQNKIWNEIKNLTFERGIDSFGLTHMSCDVLSRYGVTNLFNSDAFVCLNGMPFSAYHLNYVIENLQARDLRGSDMPILSYTHINIAHESSGNRIISMDTYLADFVTTLGKSSDTLTILLSDHGGKMTNYSRDSLAGRFEVYDPFLFMIVPKKLREVVGDVNMRNLIDNQDSLLDVIDLRSMLITLNKILRDPSTSQEQRLLTESIKHRGDCQHISIRNYGLCKCFANVTFPDKNDPRYKQFLIWLGEFAVGHINNIISSMQLPSRAGHRCHRIQANNTVPTDTIANVVQRHTARGVVYLFDVSTVFDGIVEVFNFQVLFNEKRLPKRELLTVEHWMRVSIYSPYASCRDKEVSHELCLCRNDMHQRERVTKKFVNDYKQFDVITHVVPVDNTTCAYLLRRTNLYVVAFELVNMCGHTVNVDFATPMLYSWASSHNLPVVATVKAHSLQFLVTFIKIVDLQEDIKPIVVFK